MKKQAARSILALGLIVGLAGTSQAGPTNGGSPTPTGSPTGTPTGSPTASPTGSPTGTVTGTPTATPTGTVTGSPTPTPTGTVTGTPTATPTGTVTGSPTPTATGSPTATPPPGDLEGQFFFHDRKNLNRSMTLMDVDPDAGRFCLAGRFEGTDPTVSFPRSVVFTYQALGSIKKGTDKVVKGDFRDVPVVLTLTIAELPPGTTPPDTRSIVSACSVKGDIRKFGERGNARLKCDVGRNFADLGFDVDNEEDQTDQNLVENVTDAFPPRKGIKVNTRSGKIRVIHRGEPAPEGAEIPEDLAVLDCSNIPTPTPTATATPTPTATATGSPTATPTGTVTGSPTATPTATVTGSPTGTPTGTPTGSPTGTPTGTPTGSPTGTPTGTPTPTPSPTPTGTT